MKAEEIKGDRGRKGWTIVQSEYALYRESVDREWRELDRLWQFSPKKQTDKVIAYEMPGEDGPVRLMRPTDHMMAMLMRGGIIRHIRVIDHLNGEAIFDGTGEILPAMSESEALDHIRWKFMPVEVNHWKIISEREIPSDRTFRNAWRLAA